MPSDAEIAELPVRPDGRSPSLTDLLLKEIRGLHAAEKRGDLASLRRMDADTPLEPAFLRILVKVAPRADVDEARRIGLLVKIMALAMSADVLSARGDVRLGAVMHETGVSERRVQGLMTARGPTLDDHLVRLARRLVKGGTLPVPEIGRLILGSPETVERTRFDIARAYWTAADKADASPTAPQAATLPGEPE